jgi:hypothetical protein
MCSNEYILKECEVVTLDLESQKIDLVQGPPNPKFSSLNLKLLKRFKSDMTDMPKANFKHHRFYFLLSLKINKKQKESCMK